MCFILTIISLTICKLSVEDEKQANEKEANKQQLKQPYILYTCLLELYNTYKLAIR